MKKNIKDKKNSTAVITDIRNFSQTFKAFQNANSTDFLEFIEKYYISQNALARIISKKVHMSSTGDGILAIFLDKSHYREGYAYILASYKLLSNLCNEFNINHASYDISFGMGADSGNVWSVGQGYLNTYVGTVINRASRIESTTKLFGNTTTAIGNRLYKSLVRDFYPSSYELMEEISDYDELLNTNPDAILISKHFMLQYVFDMQLKGLEANAPIFRLSQSLASDEKLYWRVMNKLLAEKEITLIKALLQSEVEKAKS